MFTGKSKRHDPFRNHDIAAKAFAVFFVLFVAAIVYSNVYTNTHCLKWQEIPGHLSCYTWGHHAKCEPEKQCVSWKP